ncbi:MAG: hypothetical protein AAFV45_14555 [Pseudomonadota bacterium]
MDIVVTAVAAICFAFAAGIFTVLSYIEKPVWSLMRDPTSTAASDDTARLIHGELNRVIRLLPPTMKTTMATATVLLLTQAWLRDFDWLSLGAMAVFAAFMTYLLFHLEARIKAVAEVPSDGSITAVRDGLGKLAALHHVGLAMAVTMLALQLTLIGGPGR